jgi:DEAD/DEAH box helicase domain-containing protein
MEHKWREFFQNLKLVVLDELHVYTGLFGTHVAWVLRRLRRICAAVGNEGIRFVGASATIGKPEKHMERLLGMEEGDVRVVSEDGSPSGRKEYVVWNPPLMDSRNPKQGTVTVFWQISLFSYP